MNYEDRDTLGMYKASGGGDGPGPDVRHGPGPGIMGADTLVGNDVYNREDENLGDIKEIMLDMRSGKVGYAVLAFGGRGPQDLCNAVERAGARHQEQALRVGRVEGSSRRCARVRQGTLARFDKEHWPNMADLSVERSAAYGMQPRSSRLLDLGMWFLVARRDKAMWCWWYNHVLMPLGVRFQKKLALRSGLLVCDEVDEILLISGRQTRPTPGADTKVGPRSCAEPASPA